MKTHYISPEMQARKRALIKKIADLEVRCNADPKSAKAPQIKAKIEEHLATIKCIDDYGQDSKPTGNPVGVHVGAPLGGGK